MLGMIYIKARQREELDGMIQGIQDKDPQKRLIEIKKPNYKPPEQEFRFPDDSDAI